MKKIIYVHGTSKKDIRPKTIDWAKGITQKYGGRAYLDTMREPTYSGKLIPTELVFFVGISKAKERLTIIKRLAREFAKRENLVLVKFHIYTPEDIEESGRYGTAWGLPKWIKKWTIKFDFKKK